MAKQRVTKGTTGVAGVTGWISGVASTIGVDRVGNVIGGAIDGAARTKASVDRNIEGIMSLTSLPTKRDFHRLLTKVESLQGSLINVSKKLDKLSGEVASMNGRKPASKPSRSRGKTSNKPSKRSKARKTRAR